MNILHVIPTLGVGGAERLMVVQLSALKKSGDTVAVAVLKGPFDLQLELEAAGIDVIRLPAHHRWNLISGARGVSRLAKDRKADVVHAHLYFPAIYVGLAHWFGILRARSYVTFHNLAYVPGANKSNWRLFIHRQLAKLVYSHGFTEMMGVSKAAADHYQQALNLRSVLVLHNPVDLADIDHNLEHLPEPELDAPPNIILPGRLVHEKGHKYLISALKTLKDRGIAYSATFAGGGPKQDDITEQVSQQDLAHEIEITGTLTHPEMIKRVGQATVVAIPSTYEGFGITALEAMAASRPVVATMVGGLPEVLGDPPTGVLIPPADPDALADALQTLLASPELRAKLGAAGRKRAETHFSVDTNAQNLRDIYTGTGNKV